MGVVLTVTLTRISPTHHRLSFQRADGSGETVQLETRSCLFHDLMHFALESEAGLQCSFYGLLAAGAGYHALADEPAAVGVELVATERIVGGLTAVTRARRPRRRLSRRDAEPVRGARRNGARLAAARADRARARAAYAASKASGAPRHSATR